MDLGSLPAWAAEIAGNLHRMGLFDRSQDQVIVNEYNPVQGIGAHIDCKPCHRFDHFGLRIIDGPNAYRTTSKAFDLLGNVTFTQFYDSCEI